MKYWPESQPSDTQRFARYVCRFEDGDGGGGGVGDGGGDGETGKLNVLNWAFSITATYKNKIENKKTSKLADLILYCVPLQP